MSDYVVVYSRRARRNLRDIERFIAKKGSPRNAERFIIQIVERCERIATAPFQGQALDNLKPGLRRTGMEGRVSVLFSVKHLTVTILSVAYGGREYESDYR